LTIQRRVFKGQDPAVLEMPQGAPAEPADAPGETGVTNEAPAPESALAKAQAALAENDQAIAGLVAERNALLVRDEVDETEVERIDGEIGRCQRRQKTLTDRLALLAAEAQREAAEHAAQAREAKITEVEHLFIARDAAAADLRDHLVAADQAFRKVYELGVAARAAWSWEHGQAGGTLTAAHDLTREVSSFLYRIAGRPASLGGIFQATVPPPFPGGKCPRIEWLQSPDKLPDLAAQYRDASRFASDIMRGVRADGAPNPASPADAGQSDAPVIEQLPTTSPIRATPNPELSKLLARQAVLAMREDPASEAEYIANGKLVQELSA
jgi:predicted DNA-binding protein